MGVIDLFSRGKAALMAAAALVAMGSQDSSIASIGGGRKSLGYFGPHSSPNYVAHDKRRARKVRNKARHRVAMKRRGK